ncbi:hypothetical protein ABE41_018485 [Fictibacillus arsenicus]|uniref:Uncharacterized protein n=1 Tax=Fictibacillus arsenicus TaxID=255247 RepID=A0A1B1Z991_9BACL|nr:hypothetical protein ABE41_018485 [Fictibacillus arsenicus]
MNYFLKPFVDKLIGAEGARLLENKLHIFFVRYKAAEAFPVLREQRAGETPPARSDREAHRTPRGKRVAGAEINSFNEQQSLRK